MSSEAVTARELEGARLVTLRSFRVLDTPRESVFDAIARLAAEELSVSAAAITLVDTDRCWFKARVGFEADEMPRNASFCGRTFAEKGLVVVPDARADERFKDLPIVNGGSGFRFYAGAPLRASDGHSIGTLCVLDRIPRDPTPRQLDRLAELASRVMGLLHDRRAAAGSNAPVAPAVIAPTQAADIVLVVDDEDSVRAFTVEVLKHLGHKADSAANGADALVRVAELGGRVRLVVTDLSMPVMGGLELVRALRRMPQSPAVIVMSGHFNPDFRAALGAEGVRWMLGKPFSVDELKIALLQATAPA